LSQQGTDPNKISGLDAEQRSQRTSAKLKNRSQKRPPTEAPLFVPRALAAFALKHADGCFSLRIVDRP
jgi:hypothetical protein